MENNRTKKYEESLFYQIHSSALYFDKLFEQVFKKINAGISAKENLALIIISDLEDCCQRDLAKLILKDRASTGKLANSLEKKGLIKINVKTKNNRPVKILTTTSKGEKIIKKINLAIKPLIDEIYDEISLVAIDNIVKNLKNFRTAVQKAVKTNI